MAAIKDTNDLLNRIIARIGERIPQFKKIHEGTVEKYDGRFDGQTPVSSISDRQQCLTRIGGEALAKRDSTEIAEYLPSVITVECLIAVRSLAEGSSKVAESIASDLCRDVIRALLGQSLGEVNEDDKRMLDAFNPRGYALFLVNGTAYTVYKLDLDYSAKFWHGVETDLYDLP